VSVGGDRPNIALIGFMAVGKTSVGQVLSVRCGMPFRDVDQLVEEGERASIAEIFALRGEQYFREVEGRIFRALCAGEGQIIGCGGGTLLDPLNRAALRSRCVVVWLRASAQEVIRRLAASGVDARPLLKGNEPRIVVPPLLSAREDLYRGADLPIETEGRSAAEIAAEIAQILSLPPVGGMG
jgi:shikimate kinase